MRGGARRPKPLRVSASLESAERQALDLKGSLCRFLKGSLAGSHFHIFSLCFTREDLSTHDTMCDIGALHCRLQLEQCLRANKRLCDVGPAENQVIVCSRKEWHRRRMKGSA